MRIYKPEKVSEILSEMKESSGLLQILEAHKQLKKVWQKIPDPTLKGLDLVVSLDTNGILLIECPSSVTLYYVRSRQGMIESFLHEQMQEFPIRQVNITLSKR